MNKICRGCYNERFIIKTKVKEKIRDQGGIEAKRPAKSEREDYERRTENLLRDKRPGRIHGLKSAAAAALNGQLCRLVSLDDAVGRWTVELSSETSRHSRRPTSNAPRRSMRHSRRQRLLGHSQARA